MFLISARGGFLHSMYRSCGELEDSILEVLHVYVRRV